MDELPSLEIISQQVRQGYDEQLSHADALDSKAGIVLGFSGVLIALAVDEVSSGGLLAWGGLSAAASAVMALLAFLPRPFVGMSLKALRNKYLTHQAEHTKLRVLDTMISHAERNSDRIKWKAGLLRGAFGFLSLAVVLLAIGAVVQ